MKLLTRITGFSVLLIAVCLLTTACSTKKNTAATRFYHSFTARYNTYFNGQEAYKEGIRLKTEGNKDDFTTFIPLFTVGNEASRSLGKGQFETTITKCEKAIKQHSIKKRPVVSAQKKKSAKLKEYLARKEFNPFLKNAWLLMGMAQFQKGEFVEAASTFSYITRVYNTQPEVLSVARAWLARCYTELEWFYDAEDTFNKMGRDSITRQGNREKDASMADFLIRTERYEEAIPYLTRTVKRERNKKLKARGYYLLGQLYSHTGNRNAAYKALQKSLRQSPPYELAFNARVLQTEVISKGQSKKMVKRLKRMAKSPNNKEYLDQIFYAIGNIYLNDKDTAKAIQAYEEGGAKSTRNGLEKGILLLRLGHLYWERKDYAGAQRCYGQVIGLIEKTHDEYELINRRSKVLDELVPHTITIHTQDSLQALVRMPENERLAAIDKQIELLKEREKQAKKAAADSAAKARRNDAGGDFPDMQQPDKPAQPNQDNNKAWYFYNQPIVMQGKADFQRRWGNRKLEDNWRRSNRTVLNSEDFDKVDYEDEAATDSIAQLDDAQPIDSIADDKKELAAEDDPHKREYYLKQLPFTEKQLAASDALIKEALFQAGIIEKDQLEDFDLAAETLNRLLTQYPDFTPMEEVLYHLFLLESRRGRKAEADVYRNRLATEYPDYDYTRLITDPDYERNALYGKEIEDSLYTATYEAYRVNDLQTLKKNCERSANKFPTGANRPKFMFLHALSFLQTGQRDSVVNELKTLVQKYPESDVSEMAGMIVKGIESGRIPGTGHYDIGSLWSRRSISDQATGDSTERGTKLSDERNTDFVVLFAFPVDSINEDQLLYDLARYNFTSFMVRNFDIRLEHVEGIGQLRLSGFRNFDEAHAYVQQLFGQKEAKGLTDELRRTRIVIISDENMQLLGTRYSYVDYQEFYDRHFAPLKINPELPLDDNTNEIAIPEENIPGETIVKPDKEDETDEEDDGEWYSE